jgi:NAD(P)-dependent dehydrogenase (short-subunit alcohol dehydrogenase family)
MTKTVLVTGGSSGLGLATTKAFRNKRTKVIVASRNLEKFKDNLGEPNKELIFIETDFSNMDSVKALYEKIEKDYPKLDIAVNNVGAGSLKLLTQTTEEDFDHTINVNLKSLWLSLKHQISLMQQDSKSNKHIVNVSSINGLGGAEYLSLYAAAKAGVISLTKSAALETAGSNICINAIVPGPFDTPMLQGLLSEQSGNNEQQRLELEEKYKKVIPQNRFGDPEEFANTVLWLTEGTNKFISGHSLIIDGGLSSRFR